MPKLDLTDEEHAAVAALVRRTVADSRFPFSGEFRTLRAALEKLEPEAAPKPRPQLPPLPSGPLVGSRRKARR